MKKVFNTFFSKEYLNYDSNNLDFRKRILKILQICVNIFVIIFMILLYPFDGYPLEYFIYIPLVFAVSNLLSLLLLRLEFFRKFITLYICLLRIMIPIVTLELSMELVRSLEKNKTIAASFIGIQAGLMYSLSFLTLSPPLYKIIMSVALLIHLVVKQFTMGNDDILFTSFVFISIFVIVDCIYYRNEMLNLSRWTALMKKNEGLEHFEKLIQIFPSQILVLDKRSLESDRALYFNSDAQRLREELLSADNLSVSEFLEKFEVIEGPIESSLPFSSTGERSLKSLIKEVFSMNEGFKKDFYTFVLSIKSNVPTSFEKQSDCDESQKPKIENELERPAYKWEVKIGNIEWEQNEALIIIFSDISKAEKIRELKLLDKNKDKLMATVSHELRTPLNGIIGMIDVSIEELLENPEKVKGYLEFAKNSAKYLLHMINDILDLSQIRNGKLRLSLEWTNLLQAIERVIPLISIQLKKRSVEFIYENRCPDNTYVFADPIRLQQILMNLLGNASKFTLSGYIKLSAALLLKSKIPVNAESAFDSTFKRENPALNIEHSEEGSNLLFELDEQETAEFVEISVEDTGKGIKENERSNLFKLFGKIETEGNTTGVGLGLAISQSLAKNMQSTGIEVESVYGKGSKFFFRLRASSGPKISRRLTIPQEIPNLQIINDTVFRKPNIVESIIPSRKKRLLVVDDDQVNQLVISLYLKGLPKDIISDKAFNGEEAIKLIEENANMKNFYDLILMDCDMPVMNGFQASVKIRSFIELGTIPEVKIVALTANASLFDKESCLQHGMLDVWTKPISRGDFIQKLSELI